MEMTPPKLIEDGMVATVQTSPNVKKNAAVGGLVMLVLACGVITLSVIMNDTIRSEEDVFKYLELPVLAVVRSGRIRKWKEAALQAGSWKKEKSVREARLQEKG